MKHNTPVGRYAAAAVALEKIKQIAEQLAHAPADGRLYHLLTASIRIEAQAYRKALDVEQAKAGHDRRRRPLKPLDASEPLRRPRSTSRRERDVIRRVFWLFTRDEESIWIERPDEFSMDVAGPGAARAHLDFPNERAAQAFRAATEERLTRGGWFRSKFDHDRRTQSERRRGPRATVNRRLPVVEARPW